MLSKRIASRLRDLETPFYLYDTELLRQTLESVVNESQRYNYKVHYAIKANYDDRLLSIIREYGLGVDCASGNEIRKGTIYSKYKQFIANCFEICPRQALHAATLGFSHPKTGEWLQFESPLPEDMAALLDKWRKYCGLDSLK